jgi:hypothetical protein
MRTLVVSLAAGPVLLFATKGRADEIGTTPALAKDAPLEAQSGGPSPNRDVFIARSPPKDWAVVHVGFRPHIGTFPGLPPKRAICWNMP